MIYNNIERCCQLHERVELLYVVDGYDAVLSTKDGDVEVLRSHGETIDGALDNLDLALINLSLEDVRQCSST